MKGEEVLQLQGKSTGLTIHEVSERGIKFAQNSDNQVSGKFTAMGPSTVTVHQKPDGTSDWENKGFMSTMEGDFIAFWGNGSGKQMGPKAEYSGELHFMSQSPKFSWLNEWKGWVEGVADQSKGEYTAKVFEWK